MLCVHLELSIEDSWNTHRVYGLHTLHRLWINVLLNSTLCLDKSTLQISFCSLYYRWFRLRLLTVTYTIYTTYFTLYFTLCTQNLTHCKLHSTHWTHVGWITVLAGNTKKRWYTWGCTLLQPLPVVKSKIWSISSPTKENIWIVISCFYYFWLLVIDWLTDWLAPSLTNL